MEKNGIQDFKNAEGIELHIGDSIRGINNKGEQVQGMLSTFCDGEVILEDKDSMNTPNGKFGFKIEDDSFGPGGEGVDFYITIRDIDSGEITNEEMSDEYDYPQGMVELQEGIFEYSGDLTKDEMRSELIEIGLNEYKPVKTKTMNLHTLEFESVITGHIKDYVVVVTIKEEWDEPNIKVIKAPNEEMVYTLLAVEMEMDDQELEQGEEDGEICIIINEVKDVLIDVV